LEEQEREMKIVRARRWETYKEQQRQYREEQAKIKIMQ